MKKKITLRAFCATIFTLGVMSMNAQVGVNLLSNFDFALPSTGAISTDLTTVPDDWNPVDSLWFVDYYSSDENTWNAPPPSMKNPRADSTWAQSSAPNLKPYMFLTQHLVARIPEVGTGGMFQVVTVTPGATYEYGCDVVMRLNNFSNDCLKGDETLKILTVDGADLYTDRNLNTTPMDTLVADTIQRASANGNGFGYAWIGAKGVKGKVTIPAGLTQVRFQFDQRNYPLRSNGGLGNSPVMLVDNCFFQLSDATGFKTPQVNGTVSVFPNPALTDITVSGTVSGAKIKLFSVGGALLQTIPAQESSTNIDVSSLPKGLYLLQTGGQTLKVIKK